jgi:AraC-like DNA-binding protein
VAHIENRAKVWRMPDLHNAQMLKGIYVDHAYPWHAHEEVTINLVIEGAIHLRHRSLEADAAAGFFCIANAEELHRGHSATPRGWSCRTLHLHPEISRGLAEEIASFRSSPHIAFRGPIVADPDMAQDFLHLHRLCEKHGSSLERQTLFLSFLAKLLARHAETRLEISRPAREPSAVRRAREYLDEHLLDKVTLEDLATAAGITPFRLLRAFRHAFGLTPHAYQLQARVRAAHALIVRHTAPLADIALTTGFADQAHLTRVFKSVMGATPGQFQGVDQRQAPR